MIVVRYCLFYCQTILRGCYANDMYQIWYKSGKLFLRYRIFLGVVTPFTITIFGAS